MMDCCRPDRWFARCWSTRVMLGVSIGRLLACTLPVVYVWSLPFLATVGFAHTCKGYPRCKNVGASVSSFICNTKATGALAFSFFYPCMLCWMNARAVRHQGWVSLTLGLFQACFGAFLMCPVEEVPVLHGIAVVSFCVMALLHYWVLLRHCETHRLRWCVILVRLSLVAFTAVVTSVCVSKVDNQVLPREIPWAFFIAEASGLSSMAIFPALWAAEVEAMSASFVAGEVHAVAMSAEIT
eukprot:TRINITY_DN46011_c0_g1_i1.p1 TRINITY_DN46011_c0_g1~~TRINITY_DN46011_c0_g1_i1.p1  ORF type:complete len:240 (+),score=9.36 TRINITY_DN46011_c0_g1_i1:41-760(+)